MPIVQMIDKKRGEEIFYAYVFPDQDLMSKYATSTLYVLNQFLSEQSIINADDVVTNYASIIKIAQRIDQRKEYFKIYHNNTHMSEIREAGLHAYWICKYRPFSLKRTTNQDDPIKGDYLLNEMVAIKVIISMITAVIGDKPFRSIPYNIFKDLTYSFGQHELCKESFLLIAEMLYEYAIVP
jgi:hypothetical protein